MLASAIDEGQPCSISADTEMQNEIDAADSDLFDVLAYVAFASA